MFHFHHVALSVSNTEKSKKFYSYFGFRAIHFWEVEDKSLAITQMKLGEAILELFCFKKHRPLPDYEKSLFDGLKGVGAKHFGISTNNLEEAKEQLEKAGIAENIEITAGKTGINYFFVKDPDGILLEILEDKRNI